jgi:hypothetical protein
MMLRENKVLMDVMKVNNPLDFSPSISTSSSAYSLDELHRYNYLQSMSQQTTPRLSMMPSSIPLGVMRDVTRLNMPLVQMPFHGVYSTEGMTYFPSGPDMRSIHNFGDAMASPGGHISQPQGFDRELLSGGLNALSESAKFLSGTDGVSSLDRKNERQVHTNLRFQEESKTLETGGTGKPVIRKGRK